MEEKGKKSQEEPIQKSLLDLNDYCVMDILEFLEYHDLVRLSNTCTRLRSLCVHVCFNKYSEIEVQARVQMPLDNQLSSNRISQQDFKDFSTMVGRNHLRIKELDPETLDMYNYSELLFSCTPLQLSDSEESRQKLKLPDVIISANDLKKCFINNPEMQCEYVGSYDPNVMELLVSLPKLMSLQLGHISGRPRWSAQIFDIIASFENLEVLSLHGHINIVNNSVLEYTALPVTLKKININVSLMAFNIFTSIIERLEFLEEINLGQSRMFWYEGNCKLFCVYKVMLHAIFCISF